MSDATPLTEPETPNPDPVTSPSGSANGGGAALYAALSRAQGQFPPIPRDRTVTVKGTNKKTGKDFTYTFSYAPLDTILDAVRPALSAEGLAVTQALTLHDGQTVLATRLVHSEGGELLSVFPLPTEGRTPQELGSVVTYLRRYCLQAMLGVATEEDDDGNHASGNTAMPSPDRRGPQGGRTAAAPAPTSPSAPPPAETPEQHRQRLTQHWDDAKLADLNNRIGAIDDGNMLRTLLEIEGERELRGKGKPRKTLLTALSARIGELEAVGDQAVTGSAPTEASHSGDPVPPPSSSDGEPPPADASRSPETAQDTEPASPSDHLLLVQAALAWIQEQPGSVEQPAYWTVPNVLLGISQQGGEAYATLADVPGEWLEAVFNAVPADVRQSVGMLGPEQLSALAAQAK